MHSTSQSNLAFHIDRHHDLASVLRSQVACNPDGVAFIFLVDGEMDAVTMTYSQLDEYARKYASSIRDHYPDGGRAILLYGPGLEFIAAFFGALYAGLTAVPTYLPPRQQRARRLNEVMKDADTNLILTTNSERDSILKILPLESIHHDIRWVTDEDIQDADPGTWSPPILTPESIAFLQYTSGSTSQAKAVMVSHRNVIANSEAIRKGFQNNPSTIGVSWLPHYHDMGLIGNLLQPIYSGHANILIPPFYFIQRPVRWLEAITRYSATTSGGPNFAYEHCLAKITSDQKKNLDLSSWKLAYTGAERIRAETLRRFADAFAECGFDSKAYYACYGLAESTLFVTGSRWQKGFTSKVVDKRNLRANRIESADIHTEEDHLELVSSGSTVDGHDLIIVDPVSLDPCPDGRIGEVWVKGPSVAQGYWRRPELTTSLFAATTRHDSSTHYLRTGDLGVICEGELYITGRIKDLIIVRGQNYYPQDIEYTVFETSDALSPNCGAVFTVDHDDEERLVVAQEIARRHVNRIDFQATAEMIRHNVFRKHGLKVHAVLLLKPAGIPKTSSGKIKRLACKDQFLYGKLPQIHAWYDTSLTVLSTTASSASRSSDAA